MLKMALGFIQGWLNLTKADIDALMNVDKAELMSLVDALEKAIPETTCSQLWQVTAQKVVTTLRTKI